MGLTLTSTHFHPFATSYSRDLASWSEIALKLSTQTPDRIAHKYDVTSTGDFRPFVKQSKLQKYSMAKHPPQSLDNEQSKRRMVSWFEHEGQRVGQERLEKVVVSGNQMANEAIERFA